MWFKGLTACLILKVTSDLWPEGLEGQLSWAGTRRGLGVQAVVGAMSPGPKEDVCCSHPHPRALRPLVSSSHPPLPEGQEGKCTHIAHRSLWPS